MNDWEDLYKNQKNDSELYKELINYSKHFNAPFPMFMIGDATVDILKQCIQKNHEYEPSEGLIY